MASIIIGFGIGILSSLFAAVIIGLHRRARFGLSFRRVLRQIVELAQLIRTDGFNPDFVVCIDRNSGIVASIMAAHFGLLPVVSVATNNERNSDGTRSINIPEPYASTLELLGGKKVLVVICCNDTGTSLGHVVDHLTSRRLPPTEVRTCALYSSISPSVQPRYVSVVVGEDTKKPMNHILRSLPWVTKDWRLVFAEERHRFA